jgi:hypothetical protein
VPRAHQPPHQHAVLPDLVAWLLTLIVKERIVHGLKRRIAQLAP